MVNCAVKNCKNNSRNKDRENVTFHRFPRNEKRQRIWLEAIGREEWNPSKTSVICSKHFTEDCLNRTYSSGAVYLKDHAVPSLFLDIDPVDDKSGIKVYCGKISPADETLTTTNNSFVNDIYGIHSYCSKISPSDDEILTTSAGTSTVNDIYGIHSYCIKIPPANEILATSTGTSKRGKQQSDLSSILRYKLQRMTNLYKKRMREMKILRQSLRRKTKKIANMKSIIKELKSNRKTSTR